VPALQVVQNPEVLAPVWRLAVPWGHIWHPARKLAPGTWLYRPAGHAPHALTFAAPAIVLNVPGGHSVQLVRSGIPWRPGSHEKQTTELCSEYVPNGQSSQRGTKPSPFGAEPLTAFLPGLHGVHSELARPDVRPDSHATQSNDPMGSAFLPGVHAAQTLPLSDPISRDARPGEQAMQSSASCVPEDMENRPAPQSLQTLLDIALVRLDQRPGPHIKHDEFAVLVCVPLGHKVHASAPYGDTAPGTQRWHRLRPSAIPGAPMKRPGGHCSQTVAPLWSDVDAPGHDSQLTMRECAA